MSKQRRIILPKGGNKQLQELTGCCENTVRYALLGNTGGREDLKALIRKRALEIGGVYAR